MSFIARINRSNTGRVVAAGAVVLALGGGTATAATLITGKQIKDSSVTGADIKNGSLGDKELTPAAKKALTGKTGPAGATGPAGPAGTAGPAGIAGPAGAKGDQGDQGVKGDKGDRGPSNAEGVNVASNLAIISAEEVLGGQVNAGSYVFQGKVTLETTNAVAGTPVCKLFVMRGEFKETLDTVDGLRLTESGTDGDAREYVLMAATKVDVDNSGYGIDCEAPGAIAVEATDRALIATQVDKLN